MESLETTKVIWLQIHIILHKSSNFKYLQKIMYSSINVLYRQIAGGKFLSSHTIHSNKLIYTKRYKWLRRLEEFYNFGIGNSFIILYKDKNQENIDKQDQNFFKMTS